MVEASDMIVYLVEPNERTIADEKFLDANPQYKGIIKYIIYRAKKSRGRDIYWLSERGSGKYFYTADRTFNDFVKWFCMHEGFNIYDKIQDYTKYGSEIL